MKKKAYMDHGVRVSGSGALRFDFLPLKVGGVV